MGKKNRFHKIFELLKHAVKHRGKTWQNWYWSENVRISNNAGNVWTSRILEWIMQKSGNCSIQNGQECQNFLLVKRVQTMPPPSPVPKNLRESCNRTEKRHWINPTDSQQHVERSRKIPPRLPVMGDPPPCSKDIGNRKRATDFLLPENLETVSNPISYVKPICGHWLVSEWNGSEMDSIAPLLSPV